MIARCVTKVANAIYRTLQRQNGHVYRRYRGCKRTFNNQNLGPCQP